MELIMNFVVLTFIDSLYGGIVNFDFAFKKSFFTYSGYLDKNQSSHCVHCTLFDLNFWWKSGLNVADKETAHFFPLSGLLLLSIDNWLDCIRGPVNLNSLNVIRLECQNDISSTGEEGIIEGLEEIFENVLFVGGTEIVKAFGVFESFTGLRVEIIGNSDNRKMNFFLISCILYGVNSLSNAMVAHIR